MSSEQLNQQPDEIKTLEYGINDLRHQLITHTLYRSYGKKYLPDIEEAPPIDILQETNGLSINLFLDNQWGVNKKRILDQSTEKTPQFLKEVWSAIQMPGMKGIVEHYDEKFDTLGREWDEGWMPDNVYNAELNRYKKEFAIAKSMFISENEIRIMEGIQRDLETVIHSI